MEKAFAVSDIHGCYEQFIKLLDYWDREMKLVIMGDLIDRGQDSKRVVQEVMKLKETYPDQVIVLKGNHEDLFLQFLQDPLQMGDLYFFNGGNVTVKNFIEENNISGRDMTSLAGLVQQKADREVEFLQGLPLYEEFGKVLFVHAGINTCLPDWRNTASEDFLWTRNMVNYPNETGKIVVYGHTPTQMIHPDRSSDIWVSEDRTYINIDGGCAYGGQLNAVVVNERGEILEQYSVSD